MKQRSDEVYLKHILDSIARIETYLQGVDKNTFLETPLVQDAVVRQMGIIGEAARQVSRGFRAKHPGVPWRDWMDIRNRLIHEYFGVNLEAV
ncbi:MAG: DUF86 domain-containing protein [Euryarchaeota archaeon]|nr:DUF86 domain-containing protein [Euryarchaeota archaeon]